VSNKPGVLHTRLQRETPRWREPYPSPCRRSEQTKNTGCFSTHRRANSRCSKTRDCTHLHILLDRRVRTGHTGRQHSSCQKKISRFFLTQLRDRVRKNGHVRPGHPRTTATGSPGSRQESARVAPSEQGKRRDLSPERETTSESSCAQQRSSAEGKRRDEAHRLSLIAASVHTGAEIESCIYRMSLLQLFGEKCV
jgi:hypothetical protein